MTLSLDNQMDLLLADGLEKAFLGVGRRCSQPDVAVYSIEKSVEVLMEESDLGFEEALEYLEFNTIGAWVGDQTPVWVHEMTLSEALEMVSA